MPKIKKQQSGSSLNTAIDVLTDITSNSISESRKLRAALGLIEAENIILQRERIEERVQRYHLLYPPKD